MRKKIRELIEKERLAAQEEVYKELELSRKFDSINESIWRLDERLSKLEYIASQNEVKVNCDCVKLPKNDL